jgi:hypothetical protein
MGPDALTWMVSRAFPGGEEQRPDSGAVTVGDRGQVGGDGAGDGGGRVEGGLEFPALAVSISPAARTVTGSPSPAVRNSNRACGLPLLVENSGTSTGLGFHDACRYSLMSPASLARRRIWVAGTGKAMTSGSSSGARKPMPSPWWLRPVL